MNISITSVGMSEYQRIEETYEGVVASQQLLNTLHREFQHMLMLDKQERCTTTDREAAKQLINNYINQLVNLGFYSPTSAQQGNMLFRFAMDDYWWVLIALDIISLIYYESTNTDAIADKYQGW